MEGRAKVRAYSNIALIKYWGKEDEELAIPMNSSLSMTLDCFYTETEVSFEKDLDRDIFYLDGEEESASSLKRVIDFLDLFRKEAGIDTRARVTSENFIPTAAGLASSASGFAALGGALNIATGLNMDMKELSSYIRRGSGSGTRSVYGGFVEWQKGNSSETSYAVKLDDGDWDVAMVILVLNKNKKAISSREGMKRTVETSPFYRGWVENAATDIVDMKKAIERRDIVSMGEIAERNSLMMHGTMLGAKPPILYWQKETLEAMDLVRGLRERGIPCYFTMDAGPNVKILCKKSDSDIIVGELSRTFDNSMIIKSGIGKGITEI